ncbi:hypothetical protein POPTR_006G143000v4 [Populus trichocarpa]|uniref:Uncharacterized protein n=2 Tax=Populus trichocarpa TaxID=3694 RepID=A0ACC0SUC7_POPTR|nr:uncharacterized protein LOC18100349 isoform X2 [Populus trichocarpa]KAI9392835.1 hypothetical protein POPTR_006G143000v4 [Populus trichocarpa]KAI9392838.1 hypothetical protein POPTR_006G143000v4 [Populus trichocarpa]
MAKNEDTGSPGWRTSLFLQTTEDVAKAVADAATTVPSPRPSVVFSSKDDHGDSQFQKLQRHFSRMLKGFSSPPPEVKSGTYNPEVLTSQKRQWAKFQLQYLDHRPLKAPSRLIESMVVVGLHPNCDLQALQRQYGPRKSEGSGILQGALGCQNQSRIEPILEPQVHAVERTPSMSELNEILLGQEHLKQSDLSFVFRLQVADDSTLYGCCVLVEEIVQKPSGLLSMVSDKQSSRSSLSRYMLTTYRCYCILSRLPFFELHFGLLSSIFTEERLERLTKNIGFLDLEEDLGDNLDGVSTNYRAAEDIPDGTTEISQSSLRDSTPGGFDDEKSNVEPQILEEHIHSLKKGVNDDAVPIYSENEMVSAKGEPGRVNLEDCDVDDSPSNKQAQERRLPNAIRPLLRHCQYESSESSSSFQGSPSEDRNFRSDVDDMETEEASFSGQEDSSDHIDILEWAKANNHGSLQLLCEYYRLHCPARGSTLRFQPLEHLHPLEYRRPDEAVLHVNGSTIDLRSCITSLEFAEARSALSAEEEATALSTWAISCICGSLRLEHILTMFAGALLEKQIVVVCSNLGILSASVLSIVPLIRPYRWQSLLMPILPDDMLEFLDAPVPYIVGVKNKTSEVQSKLSNVILVDANKNQVKSPAIPQLPKHRELLSSLSPYHSKLVGESYLARKRPVYECTDVQVEAAKGFLGVLRSYLDSLCSNLRSHTITNVQSNNDKVSLLLKESFIDSFLSRDRPFMKLFVDTQLFSVHTDLVLSFFQKE